MKKKITYKDLMSFNPCYYPEELGKINKRKPLTIPEFIHQYRDRVKNKEDIIWVVCRKEYMSERDMRLFAVWCAREALELVDPDPRSVEVCDVAERFANGEATSEEFTAARDAARAAARDAARAAAWDAARDAAWAAARDAAWAAAWDAARDAAWAAAWDAARDAAWAAARAAARDAAGAAARDAQIDKLLTYFI